MATEFNLTEEHLELLRHAYISWCGDEYGAPCIDPKRPFGNGDVERDICKILGWPYDTDDDTVEGAASYKKASWLHLELACALQIVLLHLGQQISPGKYVLQNKYDTRTWKRVDNE